MQFYSLNVHSMVTDEADGHNQQQYGTSRKPISSYRLVTSDLAQSASQRPVKMSGSVLKYTKLPGDANGGRKEKRLVEQ